VTASYRDPGAGARRRPVEAVVLDMDGVLIEGGEVWDAVREQLTRERGGRWTAGAQAAMMGMSSPEWSSSMARELGVPMEPAAISSETVARVAARGKPAPDVYLEAAARLGVPPGRCAVVEDSASGLPSAAAAGMWVVAVPNRRYPPPAELV
jgi:beta-phosphoglucomutase-like phosphatase (HAD superfamily)